MTIYQTLQKGGWAARLLALALAGAMLGGCSGASGPAAASSQPVSSGNAPAETAPEEIVILYTNDVHGAVGADIGYEGLAAYKAWTEEKTPYVTLVDCGDAIQGDPLGAVSRGEFRVEIMNEVGYDFAILGNHEFDYGMEQLAYLLGEADAQYLACNLRYTGEGASPVVEALQPYEIVDYGGRQVAFVGVSTPVTITSSTPACFMDEQGNFVYDFYGGSGEELYTQVQATVDRCREEGADYVVLLTHLGEEEATAPFRSSDLIAATQGVDVVLDGHSHDVIPCDILNNAAGEPVLLSSTGTGLVNIGQLTIGANGSLQTTLIGRYPGRDGEVEAFIDSIEGAYEQTLGEVVAQSQVALTTQSAEGIRLVRSRETNLGDFCADAYRAMTGAQIAFVNGGGIRADLPAGQITYGEIIAVHPYGNTLCMVEATGQEILDALELGCRATTAETVGDDGLAAGEDGGFLQVSGLRYTIDTSIPSTVQLDEMGLFLSCGENRRVREVLVLVEDGSYQPLDPQATYTLASHNYMLKQSGDGYTMFADNPLLLDESMLDYQALITYVADALGGVIGEEYAAPQGRIQVTG